MLRRLLAGILAGLGFTTVRVPSLDSEAGFTLGVIKGASNTRSLEA